MIKGICDNTPSVVKEDKKGDYQISLYGTVNVSVL